MGACRLVQAGTPLLLFAGLIACGGGGGGGAAAPNGTGALTGTALDAVTRQGVPDVLVEIVDGPAAGRTVRSSASGAFRFDGIAPGSFTIRATNARSQPATASVTFSGAAGEVTLFLKPLPCATPACGAPNGCNRVLPLLGRPFDGEFPVVNHFDHTYPNSFADSEARIENYCSTPRSYNGHEGYDWIMPVGTPLKAVGPGTVTFAGRSSPFDCPLVGRETVNPVIEVEHVAPGGERFRVRYLHVSAMAVQQGQQVGAGAIIGSSGNEGCSTGPHLHFDVRRQFGVSTSFVMTDPYGWQGIGVDPWSVHPTGAYSAWLWTDAPSIRLDHGPVILEYHAAENALRATTRLAILGMP